MGRGKLIQIGGVALLVFAWSAVLLAAQETEQAHRQEVLALKPVGYWPADEGEGSVLRDLSGHGHDGTIYHTPWEKGLLNFTSGFQWVEIPHHKDFASPEVSMGGWIFNRRPVYRRDGTLLMALGNPVSIYSQSSLILRLRNNSVLEVVNGQTLDALGSLAANNTLVIDSWQHVMYCFDHNTARLYINGQLVQSKAGVPYQPVEQGILIGADATWWMLHPTGSNSLDGSVRNLMLFDRALSSEEVTKLMEATRPASQPQVRDQDAIVLDGLEVNLKTLAAALPGDQYQALWEIDRWPVDKLRSRAETLVPALDQVLKSPLTRRIAARILNKLAQSATDAVLTPALARWTQSFQDASASKEERAANAMAIAELGPRAASAAPALMSRLQTILNEKGVQPLRIEDFERNAFIKALLEIAPADEKARELLGKAFAQPYLATRDLTSPATLEIKQLAQAGRAMDALDRYVTLPASDRKTLYLTQCNTFDDGLGKFGIVYTPRDQFQGITYLMGSGVTAIGGNADPISQEDFAKTIERLKGTVPGVAEWRKSDAPNIFRAKITKIAPDGTKQSAYVGGEDFIFDGTDAKIQAWSVAVDAKGYLHVVGGQHNAPSPEVFIPGSWESLGLSRDRKSKEYPDQMYWVSTRPGDITSLVFAGHKDNPRRIPSPGYLNYMHFIHDLQGNLYVYGRIDSFGWQCWGLYRFDPSTQRWAVIGGEPSDVMADALQNVPSWKTYLHHNSKRGQPYKPGPKSLAWAWQPNFYNYCRSDWGVFFDPTNRMHVNVPIRALDDRARIIDPDLYAYSDDGGTTFHHADGTPVKLPLTANPAPSHSAALNGTANREYWELWLSLVRYLPSQAKGLPYSRSSQKAAMEKIGDTIAVFTGSRYAYVYGNRVRLDDNLPLKLEAVLRDGEVYVPQTFAGVLMLQPDQIRVDKVPSDLSCLAERWVHTINRPKAELTAGIKTITINGQPYVCAADVAKVAGRQTHTNPRGLVLIADSPLNFSKRFTEPEMILLDTVISQFDTPEKFADPEIATQNIPVLKQQGAWYEHAKVTPEGRQALSGPETVWQWTPPEQYDFSGFNHRLLGSKVPAPGVYPRLLFSPEDIPMFQERIRQNKFAQKAMSEAELLFKNSWWNPSRSDGQVFRKLATGQTSELEFIPGPDGVSRPGFASMFKGQVQGIHSTHINYNAQCLATMALYCLLTNDDKRGKEVANAIYNYCKLGEPAIDAHLATSDSEWGANLSTAGNATTQWRGMCEVVPHMELPFLLDFGGKWMSSEQKDSMRRIIAKATYGRRTSGGDGPRRCWRDINFVTWHLTHGLALATIEGLEGFDPEAYDSFAELTHDYLEWGINKNGQIFESNTKSHGGVQFQILSMITLARRGENLWGHPHWRNFLKAQAYATSPDAMITLSSGTWGTAPLNFQSVNEIKAFYPDDRCADYLLSNAFPDLDLARFDVADYRRAIERSEYNANTVIVDWRLSETQKVRAGQRLAGYVIPEPCRQRNPQFFAWGSHRTDANQMRLPGPTYPGLASTILYDTDWKKTVREELDLPLDWNDPVHGMFSAFSDTSKNASWLCLQVRPDHYLGTGHHHADAGMFHFSALGVNWFTEGYPHSAGDYFNSSGDFHNLVSIDGRSEPEGPLGARARYLGATITPQGSFAAADLSYTYSWRWCTMWKFWQPPAKGCYWELETLPEILDIFRGTERYKMRPWEVTPNQATFIPTLRTPYNPVEYVYRTVGLVRGQHSYAVVVDDLKKDDKQHSYQWRAVLGPGVWRAESGTLPRNQVLLAWDGTGNRNHAGADELFPNKDEPKLLVCALGLADPNPTGPRPLGAKSGECPPQGTRAQTFCDILTADTINTDARFRLLFIPLEAGKKAPKIEYVENNGVATIDWGDQKDTITFKVVSDKRTTVAVERGGARILKTP